MEEFFNLVPSVHYLSMLVRFCISVMFVWIITDKLFYAKSHRRDFYFTFMLTSVAVFFLVFFMIFMLEDMKTKTSIGIGIGLFGIFSIMRYRTDAMPVREMTYLFVIIALSVINAIAASASIIEIVIINGIVIGAIWLCERHLRLKPAKLVQYDRIELIVPERRSELICDLEKRLGLKITSVEIGAIDMLRDMAIVKVYYEGNTQSSEDKKLKLSKDDLTETQQ